MTDASTSHLNGLSSADAEFSDTKKLKGPKGMTVVFSGLVIAETDDNLKIPFYYHAEIFGSSSGPIPIRIALTSAFDAESASGNTKRRFGAQTAAVWSTGLWSLDGHFIYLDRYERNGPTNASDWDFKNDFGGAFDTRTGKAVTFSDGIHTLAADNFVSWSPDRPDIAILRGDRRTTVEVGPMPSKK